MNKASLYNLYLRVLLFFYWLVELWNRLFLVAVIPKFDGVYIRIHGNLVRLEVYPSNKAVGFRIGDAYFTTIKPVVVVNKIGDDEQD